MNVSVESLVPLVIAEVVDGFLHSVKVCIQKVSLSDGLAWHLRQRFSFSLHLPASYSIAHFQRLFKPSLFPPSTASESSPAQHFLPSHTCPFLTAGRVTLFSSCLSSRSAGLAAEPSTVTLSEINTRLSITRRNTLRCTNLQKRSSFVTVFK